MHTDVLSVSYRRARRGLLSAGALLTLPVAHAVAHPGSDHLHPHGEMLAAWVALGILGTIAGAALLRRAAAERVSPTRREQQ